MTINYHTTTIFGIYLNSKQQQNIFGHVSKQSNGEPHMFSTNLIFATECGCIGIVYVT